MKKSITAIACLHSMLFSFAQSDISKASWTSTPVKVDGNAREWKQPFNYYDASTKLFFAFANDDKNLYLCFQSPDEMNQMKIMRAGMKVTVSCKGKGKHKVSINFPIASGEEPAAQAAEKTAHQKFNPSDMKYAFLVQHTVMEVKGFSARNGIIPINDSSGINAAINWDDANKFTYEIAIPLKELLGDNYVTEEELLKGNVLDAEVNAMTKQDHPSGGTQGNSFSGRGGGGGRMGGGGMGGRHHDNNSTDHGTSLPESNDRASMFEKGELKQAFTLASRQDH